MDKINLSEKFKYIEEYWNPKIVGEINSCYIKIAKFKGEFLWHKHQNEDELMQVISGKIEIQFRDRNIELSQGELIIIPKGVEHCPKADSEAEIMLFEPKTTLNTGNIKNDRTIEKLSWI